MKKEFFDTIIQKMKSNPDIYFISAGLGWPRTDELKQFGSRYIQTEASEQTACDIAVGLAYDKRIPFVYTITPFYLRAFETLRTYMDHENLHVCLVGAGRDQDYSTLDGFSHEAGDIPSLIASLPNFTIYMPPHVLAMELMIQSMIDHQEPSFISIPK